MMQVYWIKAKAGVGMARPGQFVHGGDTDEYVRGFIGAVDADNERVLIYLFKPRPRLPDVEVVYESCDQDVWVSRLREIADLDPEIEEMWRDLLSGKFSDGFKNN